MRAVIQRVQSASVTIDGQIYSEINAGLLILIGITDADTHIDADWLCGKISRMRIFNDDKGLMNKSVQDIRGSLLVISQFTLFANTKKGNRPSYIKAAKPNIAIPQYEYFVKKLASESRCPVKTGVFGADMKVALLNDGPVTILVDTEKRE